MRQLPLFECDEHSPRILDLAALLDAAHRVGQLAEPAYDYQTRWPRLVDHARHGRCLAFLQRRNAWSAPPSMYATDVPQEWRYVFTDSDGYVVDESSWCSTEGGARGYLNRNRAA